MADQNNNVPLLDINRDNLPHRDEFVEALAAVVDSGRFLFGPDVVELEREVAAYSEVDNAVGCASGSDALLLALMALNIGPGDEVIVPSFTFFASVSCITRLGATPVFVDIRPDTFNIDVDKIPEAITEKTKAIIPVHLFGQCAEIDRICQLACEHDLPVIEDAAQAIGAAYHSRPAGSWGLVGCFSFYPTKNLGGMGGIMGLRILNLFMLQSLDVLTMLGFVILIGTVVNNPILIVHQAMTHGENMVAIPATIKTGVSAETPRAGLNNIQANRLTNVANAASRNAIGSVGL